MRRCDARMMFGHFAMRCAQILFLIVISLAVAKQVFALEAIEPSPGTRAMGMAGVFASQADDSTGIWYNPAGPKHGHRLRQELSVELSASPTLELTLPDGATPAAGFGGNETAVRFLGGYRAGLDLNDDQATGFGVAYMRLYDAATYVDVPRSLLDSVPFGRVESVYHQVSGALNRSVSSRFTVGASIDALWTEIDCLDFSPCVDNGPSGFGASLGALYDIVKSSERTITASATWRSRADLAYDSLPSSGIGTALESFLPDRPQSISVGVGIAQPLTWAHLRGNFVYETRDWSGAGSNAAPLSDYSGWGVGGEMMFAPQLGRTLALRVGLRQMIPDGAGEDVGVMAAGAGYGFAGRHAVDAALERREGGGPANEENTAWALSYSMQF